MIRNLKEERCAKKDVLFLKLLFVFTIVVFGVVSTFFFGETNKIVFFISIAYVISLILYVFHKEED